MIDFILKQAECGLIEAERQRECLERSLGRVVLKLLAKGGDLQKGVDQFLSDFPLKADDVMAEGRYWAAVKDYATKLKEKAEKYEELKATLKEHFTSSDDPTIAFSMCQLKSLAVDTNAKEDLYRFVDELEPGLSEKFKGSLVPQIPQPIACQVEHVGAVNPVN